MTKATTRHDCPDPKRKEWPWPCAATRGTPARTATAYIHRAWMRRGAPDDAFTGRPQIAIANTASDLTPCNSHLNEVADSVRQGVWAAGGVPLNLPVVSLGETQRAADRDALAQHGRDGHRGDAARQPDRRRRAARRLRQDDPVAADGAPRRSTCRRSSCRAGRCSPAPSAAARSAAARTCGGCPRRSAPAPCRTRTSSRRESAMIRSRGHCNTMGTASTMGLLAEALGTTLPGTAGTPAADSRLLAAAHETGRLAVEMVERDRRPSTLLSAGSFQQRDRGARRARRVDQRGRAPARDRRPPRRPPVPGRLRPHRRGRPAARRPAAGRPLPHGGPAPRGRAARGAAARCATCSTRGR